MKPKFNIGDVVVHSGGMGAVTEISFKRGVIRCKQTNQDKDDGKGVDIFYTLNGSSRSVYNPHNGLYSVVGIDVRESEITGIVKVEKV